MLKTLDTTDWKYEGISVPTSPDCRESRGPVASVCRLPSG
jgi:hypothetical protein